MGKITNDTKYPKVLNLDGSDMVLVLKDGKVSKVLCSDLGITIASNQYDPFSGEHIDHIVLAPQDHVTIANGAMYLYIGESAEYLYIGSDADYVYIAPDAGYVFFGGTGSYVYIGNEAAAVYIGSDGGDVYIASDGGDIHLPSGGWYQNGNVEIGGSLQGYAADIVVATSKEITTQECRGSFLSNYGQAAEITPQLPAPASGMHAKIRIDTIGNPYHLWPGVGRAILFDGILLDNADKISNLDPQLGDYLDLWTYRTGADTFGWAASSGLGAWIDGGP